VLALHASELVQAVDSTVCLKATQQQQTTFEEVTDLNVIS